MMGQNPLAAVFSQVYKKEAAPMDKYSVNIAGQAGQVPLTSVSMQTMPQQQNSPQSQIQPQGETFVRQQWVGVQQQQSAPTINVSQSEGYSHNTVPQQPQPQQQMIMPQQQSSQPQPMQQLQQPLPQQPMQAQQPPQQPPQNAFLQQQSNAVAASFLMNDAEQSIYNQLMNKVPFKMSKEQFVQTLGMNGVKQDRAGLIYEVRYSKEK
jgi:DNA primase